MTISRSRVLTKVPDDRRPRWISILIYGKSRGDPFIDVVKRGKSAHSEIQREKDAQKEMYEDEKMLVKSADSAGFEWRWEDGVYRAISFLFLSFLRYVWVCVSARFTEADKAERENENESRSINTVTYHSSCCRIRFTAISFAICRSWASLRSARNWNVKEKCNVYSHTTSIFQDFSTKSPVTFGFSARQVIDFPWSSTPGSNSTVLTVRFSDLSSCGPYQVKLWNYLSYLLRRFVRSVNRAGTATLWNAHL